MSCEYAGGQESGMLGLNCLVNTAMPTCTGAMPENGMLLVQNSHKLMPNEYTSAFSVYLKYFVEKRESWVSPRPKKYFFYVNAPNLM